MSVLYMRRGPEETRALQYLVGEMYIEGYTFDTIAQVLNNMLAGMRLPLCTQELEQWRTECGWQRRPEVVLLKPLPPPKPGPWEPEWATWMV